MLKIFQSLEVGTKINKVTTIWKTRSKFDVKFLFGKQFKG